MRGALERALVILAVACALGAAAARPVLRAASPHDAVQADFLRHAEEVIHPLFVGAGSVAADPWGHPYRARPLRASDPPGTYLGVYTDGGPPTQRARPIYSTGPDGVDDEGRGDDLHVGLGVANAPTAVLAWMPEWLVGLALLLLWLAAWVRRRRRTLPGEVAVVLIMVAPLLASLGAALWQLEQLGVPVPDAPLVVVPARAAVITSATLLSLLVCVGLRLAGARPADGTAAAPQASDP